MRTVLWSLFVVNVAAAGAAYYASTNVGGSVRDVLQVLAGASLLTVVGLLYLASKTSANRTN